MTDGICAYARRCAAVRRNLRSPREGERFVASNARPRLLRAVACIAVEACVCVRMSGPSWQAPHLTRRRRPPVIAVSFMPPTLPEGSRNHVGHRAQIHPNIQVLERSNAVDLIISPIKWVCRGLAGSSAHGSGIAIKSGLKPVMRSRWCWRPAAPQRVYQYTTNRIFPRRRYRDGFGAQAVRLTNHGI